MTSKKPSPRGNVILVTRVLVGLVALGIFFAAGGFTFAASQETHDPFCTSCHTEPESAYFQRSIDAQAVDLASFHTANNTRCIDCHSGSGILGRMRAELLGARNATAWYTHTAVQPAQLTVPIRDESCLKCHQDVTQRSYTPKQEVAIFGRNRRGEEEEAGPNHWHELMARWQAFAPSAGTCMSCHPGHSTDGNAQTGFENGQVTRTVCDACHRTIGEGRGD